MNSQGAENDQVIQVSIGPGFTLQDLDRLLKEHHAMGYGAGRREGYAEGFRHGHVGGKDEVLHDVSERIQRVIGGRLIHVVSGLTEVANRRRKTTIADEREWMASKARDAQAAIDALYAIALKGQR